MSGFWSGVGTALAVYALVEFFVALSTGKTIPMLISGGDSSPLVMAVASHVGGMSTVAFAVVCIISVVILSAFISLVLFRQYAGAKA